MTLHRAAAVPREGAGLLLAVPLWFWWGAWDGGYPPTVWVPGLLYLAAVAALLVFAVPLRRPPAAAGVALAGLAGLTVWTGLSVLWADDPGSAWTGAERTLLVLLAFALPLLWPPSPRALLAGVVAWVAASATGLAAGVVAAAGNVAEFAVDGRLVPPTGYANATAALAIMGALPAVVLASRRELPVVLRGALLAAAGGLVGTLLLVQSRGAVGVGGLALLAAFALGPSRLRLLAAVALVAPVVAAATPTLLDARTNARAGDPSPLDGALVALALVVAGLLVLGCAAAWLDRRATVPARAAALARRVVAVVVVVAVAGGVAAFVVEHPRPWSYLADKADDFRTPDYTRLEQSDSRFTGSLGSNRSDYWRVALDLVAEHPVAGIGADNFHAPFLVRREATTAPRYVHNLWLEVLTGLGVIGALLFLTWLGGTVAAFCAARRATAPPGRAVRAAALLPAIALVLHASADWVSFFPGLAVPAVGLAGAALAGAPARGHPARPPAPVAGATPVPASIAPWPAAVATGLVLAVLAASAVPLFVAGRLTDRALAIWPREPAAALRDLGDAQRWNPLSDVPALVEGIVAVQLGRPAVARAAYAEAYGREPTEWYAALMLGALDREAGRTADAARWEARARELNPASRIHRLIRRANAAGRPLRALEVQREALAEA